MGQDALCHAHGLDALRNVLAAARSPRREEGDTLVLGLGVPAGWLNKPFAVANLPTHFGRVSYRYVPEERTVAVNVERSVPGGIRGAFPGDVRIIQS